MLIGWSVGLFCFLLDCVSLFKPCAGEYRPKYPMMSKDGLSSVKSKEDRKTCPQEEEEEGK